MRFELVLERVTSKNTSFDRPGAIGTNGNLGRHSPWRSRCYQARTHFPRFQRDSVTQFFESERKAGRPHLHVRCGDFTEFPRLMNFQVPREKPHLKLSAGETVRDTLLFDAIRSSYREWPGTIQVDWQFGPGLADSIEIIPLDSLRLIVPVP
jgi:hypothetical protein